MQPLISFLDSPKSFQSQLIWKKLSILALSVNLIHISLTGLVIFGCIECVLHNSRVWSTFTMLFIVNRIQEGKNDHSAWLLVHRHLLQSSLILSILIWFTRAEWLVQSYPVILRCKVNWILNLLSSLFLPYINTLLKKYHWEPKTF